MTTYLDDEGVPVVFKGWVTMYPHTTKQVVKAVVSYKGESVEYLVDRDKLVVKQ